MRAYRHDEVGFDEFSKQLCEEYGAGDVSSLDRSLLDLIPLRRWLPSVSPATGRRYRHPPSRVPRSRSILRPQGDPDWVPYTGFTRAYLHKLSH